MRKAWISTCTELTGTARSTSKNLPALPSLGLPSLSRAPVSPSTARPGFGKLSTTYSTPWLIIMTLSGYFNGLLRGLGRKRRREGTGSGLIAADNEPDKRARSDLQACIKHRDREKTKLREGYIAGVEGKGRGREDG